MVLLLLLFLCRGGLAGHTRPNLCAPAGSAERWICIWDHRESGCVTSLQCRTNLAPDNSRRLSVPPHPASLREAPALGSSFREAETVPVTAGEPAPRVSVCFPNRPSCPAFILTPRPQDAVPSQVSVSRTSPRPRNAASFRYFHQPERKAPRVKSLCGPDGASQIQDRPGFVPVQLLPSSSTAHLVSYKGHWAQGDEL